MDPMDQFHDPELKAAIVRARGGHRASPALRDAVLRRLQGERPTGATENSPPRSYRMFTPFRALAIAAVLAMLVGGGLYVQHVLHERHEAEEREEYYAANKSILDAMVVAHTSKVDPAAGETGWELIATDPTDVRAVAAALSTKVGRAVPAPNFAGWTVNDVAIRQIDRVTAVQWRLSKGSESMSLVCLPKSSFVIEEGYTDYDFEVNEHAIAGFIRGEAINCVVCDPTITAKQSIALREELKRG